MAESHDWEELAMGMAHMARDLLAQESAQHTLDHIVAHAVDLVDGCEAAGIMAIRRGQVVTLASTDNVVSAADRAQDDLKEGPCFDAVNDKQDVYRIADMTTTEPRWPRYAPHAREIGIASMMGFLLFTNGENLGALNLYSAQPKAFTERSERVGWMLASHAAVALSGARTHEQLLESISTRQDIGEALGILMERHTISEQDAFEMLTETSQNRNIRVRDLARRINTTGQVPE